MYSYRILLVPSDQKWTSRALHLACALARSNGGEVILLHMVAAGHPALLGSPEGSRNFSLADRHLLDAWAAVGAHYRVSIDVVICQYADFVHGLVDAAEQLEAQAVLAALPAGRVPFWNRLRTWQLKNGLARRGATLHTLKPDGGPLEWTPSVTQLAARKALVHRRDSDA